MALFSCDMWLRKINLGKVYYALKMNQVLSMSVVYGICYEAASSDLRKETIAKRKQRLRI